MFREDEVQSLLRRALADAPVTKDDGYVPFPNVLARLSAENMDVADLVADMLTKRLQPSGQSNNRTGLARALFTEASLDALIHLRRNASGPTVSLRAAAISLGLRRSSVLQMVEAGHLLAPGTSRGTPRQVLMSSLNKFKAAHISLVDLTMRMKTSPQDAARRMAQKGIAPVIATEFQAYYPR